MIGLVVRPEQMRAMEAVMLERWIVEYLQRCYPQQTGEMGSAPLADLVQKGIADAREHGFEEDAAIRRMVHVRFLMGPDFGQETWAASILSNPELPDRAAALEEAAVQQLEISAAEEVHA